MGDRGKREKKYCRGLETQGLRNTGTETQGQVPVSKLTEV